MDAKGAVTVRPAARGPWRGVDGKPQEPVRGQGAQKDGTMPRYEDGRFTMYQDHYDRPMLELFSGRSPVGGYREDAEGDWDFALECAIRDFNERHAVTLYTLGRSGRHICIEDTPRNRRRYSSLCQHAERAARAFWASMRAPVVK